jgi:uncharacterized protein YdhG (YjbR/CyaY superfamily)
MAKTDYKTIDQYHQAFTDEVQERMQTIRDLVHRVAPEAEEVISYQIPAFKISQKLYLIYYSAYAKHISLSSPWSEAFLNEFATELKDYKVSKSAIQLPNNQPLPVDFIKKVLEFRKAEIKK